MAWGRAAWQRGVVDLTASMGLVLALGFFQNLVLARVLGPEGLGHLAVLNTVLNFANLLATGGLATSILRYSAAEADSAAAWAIFSSGFRLAAIVSAGVAIATAALSQSPLWVFDPVAALWIPVAALAIPVRALASCAVEFFQSRERIRAKAVLELLAKLILVCGVMGGAALAGFRGAVLGFVLGALVGSALALVRVRGLRMPTVPSPIPRRELLRFGSWGLFTNMLGVVLATADVLCLSALLNDARAVGFYSIAVVFQQIVRVPLAAYQDARFPEMTRVAIDVEPLRALRKRMRGHLLLLSTVTATTFGTIAPWLIPFAFGEEYASSVRPLQVLLVGHVLWSLGAAQGRSMLAAGWVEGNFWATLVAAAANVALNLLLIPQLGVLGAASATAATQLLWSASVSLLCRRHERGRLRALTSS